MLLVAGEFFTEGISGNITKWDAKIAAIELTGAILEQIGITHLNNVVKSAQSQSIKAKDVAAIIQNAIDNNKIGSQYLNQQSLTGIANYLLFGENPTKWQVLNGSSQ